MISYRFVPISSQRGCFFLRHPVQGLFTRVSDKCDRELRNSKLDLNLPLLKTSFGQKSFSFRGAKLWNKLGSEAKTTSSFSSFKQAVTQN